MLVSVKVIPLRVIVQVSPDVVMDKGPLLVFAPDTLEELPLPLVLVGTGVVDGFGVAVTDGAGEEGAGVVLGEGDGVLGVLADVEPFPSVSIIDLPSDETENA